MAVHPAGRPRLGRRPGRDRGRRSRRRVRGAARLGVAHPEQFWAAVWDHCDVPGERGERMQLPGAELWQTRFLPDARLSVARALLPASGDEPAPHLRRRGRRERRAVLVAAAPSGRPAAARAAGRRRRPRRPGGGGDVEPARDLRPDDRHGVDRRGVHLGLPDFGTAGVLDRFAQVNPLVLIAVGRYPYGGKGVPDRPHAVGGGCRAAGAAPPGRARRTPTARD